MKKIIEDLQIRLDEANGFLQDWVENQPAIDPGSDEIETFVNGAYTDAVRQCCLSLSSHNLGVERVGPVIRTVINTLTKHSIGRLPSVALLSQMLVEAKAIALMQAGEVATQSQDSTLHTDGTTKFGRKYGGFQVTTDDQSLSLGMADMMSGSAEHTFDTFEAILKDVKMACKKGLGMNNVVAQVVNSLKNTMSDRTSWKKNSMP